MQVQCFPVYSAMLALGLPTVDYFSLDIEGAEYEVLKSLPFHEGDIKLFGLEVEHSGKIFKGSVIDIKKLLDKIGYQYVTKTHYDNLFMKTQNSNAAESRKFLTVYQYIVKSYL